MRKFLALLLGVLLCLTVSAWAEQPLPQKGKTTVYQRVVSHPGAKLYSDATANTVIASPRTFTSFYVYEEAGNMVRVGVSSSASDGWLKREESTDWPQAITMLFTDQMGREPVLFFRDHGGLLKTCNAPSVRDVVEQYVALFNTEGVRIPDNCPVIATEPLEKDGQVAQNDFYLLPVLGVDSQFESSDVLLVNVACIDPGIAAGGQDDNGGNQDNNGPDDAMDFGLVFVVDTTISMKQYIDETRNLISAIYNKLSESKARDHIYVACVAFRSNVEKSPRIEYTSRVVSDFTKAEDRSRMESLLASVEECKFSTHDINEDSLAGVKEAIDSLSWDKIDSKFILLITDAGPLAGDDPTSATGMTPEGMADYLRTNGIYLTVVHVKTPLGKKNHRYAEKSYRELAMLSNGQSSYIALDASTPDAGARDFYKIGEKMSQTYCNLVEKQLSGGAPEKPKVEDLPSKASPEEQAQRQAEAIGYAMRLQFDGNRKETRAPQLVNAWIADVDIALQDERDGTPIKAVYPAVLLTKLQLSQLRKQLKLIVATAEEAFLQDSENFNFFEQLLSAAAQMSRDPSKFNAEPGANLAQMGVLDEVLTGLPYKSHVLNLTQQDWISMSTGEQQREIKRLKGLVRRYEEYDTDSRHWESFGAPNPNEWVYRVPLNMLP